MTQQIEFSSIILIFNVHVTDIDECEEDPEICGFNAKCNNTLGNFTCSCLSGYEGTAGVNCTDINECLSDPYPCPSSSTCNNTVPFFTCECFPGYHSDGLNCTGKKLFCHVLCVLDEH